MKVVGVADGGDEGVCMWLVFIIRGTGDVWAVCGLEGGLVWDMVVGSTARSIRAV